jgi:hypothetical protein
MDLSRLEQNLNNSQRKLDEVAANRELADRINVESAQLGALLAEMQVKLQAVEASKNAVESERSRSIDFFGGAVRSGRAQPAP